MNTDPNAIGTEELSMRVIARSIPGAFFTLLVSDGDIDRAATSIIEDVDALGDEAVVHIKPGDALELTRHIREAASGPIVVSGLDTFTAAEWTHLDLLRTRLAHDGAIVLVMGEPAFERMMRSAPNVASFLGGSVWRWDQSSSLLSPQERDARLVALHMWSGETNEAVIELAERGDLPSDPEYAEWLILLERGDLLER